MEPGMEEGMPPMAQYGMAMGGYDFPYETDLPEAQDGRNHSNKKPYKSQVNAVNNLSVSNKQLNSHDAKSNTTFNSYSRIIDDYDDGTPSDTSYMYRTPTEDVFFSTIVDPETKQKIGQRQSNYKLSQLTPEERSYYQNKITQELGKKQYGGMSMEDYDLPEAEYGMAMGANPRNYMGRPKSSMYARGGALNKYQTKGAVDEIDITGMTPEEARYARWEFMDKLKKDKKPITEPKYYKTVDGKRVNVAYKGPADAKAPTTPDEIKAVNRAQEALLEKQLQDPILKQKLYESTVAAFKDRDNYFNANNDFIKQSYDVYSKYAQDQKNVNPDIVAQRILDQAKRNNKMKEEGINSGMFINDGSRLDTPQNLVKRKIAKDLNEANALINEYKTKKWTSLGDAAKTVGLTPPKRDEVAIEQAATRGYADMVVNLKEGKYTDPKERYSLETFLGDPDDPAYGKGKFNLNTGATDEVGDAMHSEISPIEGIWGNTTGGHGIGAGKNVGEFSDVAPEVKKDEKKCPCRKSDGSETDTGTDANGECLPCEENIPMDVPAQPAEFWLQDGLKTAGAFANLMSIKKQMPWAPKADLVAPKPTFLDPTRELAANAEQANIQTQALGQFAGPQALSARASGVMGTASKNAADVMSKYNNANVNIANQSETNIANIENQERQLNMAGQSKLYDQNTIANQQYDNSKRQALNQLINQTANAYTNRAKTDAMNQLYPQYRVDPRTGGLMTFTKGRDMTKGAGSKDFDDYMDECRQSGLTNDDAIVKCAEKKQRYSTGATTNSDVDAATALAQYQGQNVPLQKRGGFIYSDITFPFIL